MTDSTQFYRLKFKDHFPDNKPRYLLDIMYRTKPNLTHDTFAYPDQDESDNQTTEFVTLLSTKDVKYAHIYTDAFVNDFKQSPASKDFIFEQVSKSAAKRFLEPIKSNRLYVIMHEQPDGSTDNFLPETYFETEDDASTALHHIHNRILDGDLFLQGAPKPDLFTRHAMVQLLIADNLFHIKRLQLINIGANSEYPGRELSNLTPHTFLIDGVTCHSMEGFLQSLKYKEPEIQEKVCLLTRADAKHAHKQYKNKYNWKDSQILYWQEKAYKRESEEYFDLVLRAYFELFNQSPLFHTALYETENKILMHTIGKIDPKDTVLTQKEFISILTALREKAYQDYDPHEFGSLLEQASDEMNFRDDTFPSDYDFDDDDFENDPEEQDDDAPL